MTLPTYRCYKPSGLEWLREVPAHWEGPKQLGGISSLKGRLGWQGLKAEEYLTEGPHVVSSAHFSDFRIRWDECPRVSQLRYETDSNIQLDEGDVLLMKDGAAMGKLAFVDSLPGPACLNSHLLLFRPVTIAGVSSYVPKFAFYFMQTALFQEHIRINGTGATFLGISQEAISRYKVIWPPTEEQRGIVEFLDREIAKIDALIAEQEKLLALLAEKRQASITHAVTCGLDPSVQMKYSGIPWLGELPEHWEACPLKYISRIGNGSTPSRDNPDYWSESGFPWLNSSVVNQDEVTAAQQFVTETALKECHLPIVNPPAVLVGITGQGKTRGMAVPLRFEATINQHLAYIKPTPGRLLEAYLLRAIEMAYNHLRTESDSVGSTKGAITCDQLSRLAIPLPPLAEQHAIAEHLNFAAGRFDKLTVEAELGIALLCERRSALIAAAVTGKIDVREALPREAVAA